MTSERTDVHRPSFADPAEYVEVGWFDLHPEDGETRRYRELIPAEATEYMDGNFMARGRCDHCGAGPIRYGVEFLHTPTNQIIAVGLGCANKLNLSSRSELQIRKEIEAQRREAQKMNWLAESSDNQSALDYLSANSQKSEFFHDLLAKFNRYGSLTENQVAAVMRSVEREAQFKADAETRTAGAGPVEEGRREITGEIVSVKVTEDRDFGIQRKMLVQEPNGNRVFGTIPASLIEERYDAETFTTSDNLDTLPGQTVTFKAAVTRSQKDEHFGFYKRPTGAKVEAA